MEKTVRIEFNELSKSVTTNVKLEATGEEINNYDLLVEAKDLFEQAHDYAKTKTMQKTM